MKNKILIVEDDNINLTILNSMLIKHGYTVLSAPNGQLAKGLLMDHKFIAAILDLNLPDINGLEILRYIRTHPIHKNISILILTENHDKLETILGLEMGADDYITKPFHHRELIARLNAAIRRSSSIQNKVNSVITFNNLKINTDKRSITIGEKVINLSFKEFEILFLLASNPGKVFTRNAILDRIGDVDYTPNSRIVDMHISSIRKKLNDTKTEKVYIDTITGVGYKFREF